MNDKSMNRRPFLMTVAALATAGAGCQSDEPDSHDSLAQGLTINIAGPYGDNSGTMEGTGSDQLTPITKITSYANSTYIYGLLVFWGATSKMYGSTNGISPGETLDFTDDPVKEVKVHVDASGYLRGMRFKTKSNSAYPIGYLNVTQTLVFSSGNSRLTDLVTYKGTLNNVSTIWGATFYYTTP